jgi:hypothetical protein
MGLRIEDILIVNAVFVGISFLAAGGAWSDWRIWKVTQVKFDEAERLQKAKCSSMRSKLFECPEPLTPIREVAHSYSVVVGILVAGDGC